MASAFAFSIASACRFGWRRTPVRLRVDREGCSTSVVISQTAACPEGTRSRSSGCALLIVAALETVP